LFEGSLKKLPLDVYLEKDRAGTLRVRVKIEGFLFMFSNLDWLTSVFECDVIGGRARYPSNFL